MDSENIKNAKNNFTEKERKDMKAESLLVAAVIMINGIFALTRFYFNYHIDRVMPLSCLFAFGGIFAAGVIAAIAYIILFFTALKNIKVRLVRYTFTTILITLFGILYFTVGAPYFADIFGGTKEVITNEYSFFDTARFNYLIFTDYAGNRAEVQISDEQWRILWDNPYDKEANYMYDPYGSGIRQNCVAIRYYPHMGIVTEMELIIAD